MAPRIGVTAIGGSVDKLVERAREAEADGFSSLWLPGAVGIEALVVLPVIARATATIELGTSVVQTYPRHPVVMAREAVAVAAASGPGRFTLGIGVSHRPVIESMLGMSYDTNARHLREYLEVVMPLLHEGRVRHRGEEYSAAADLSLPPGEPVPVLVAALAARSLQTAGTLADGTITWMATAAAVAGTVAPAITAAAADAGRPAPRIVAGLPVAVTDDVDAGRETAARSFAMYGTLPNYQRILVAGGVSGPAEAAIVGDESTVAAAIDALGAAGATDVWAAPFAVGDDRRASLGRTRALLRDLAAG